LIRRLTRSLPLAQPCGLPVYVVRFPATPFDPDFTQTNQECRRLI
jgi:hypothetical protein